MAIDLYNPRGAERLAQLSERSIPTGQSGVCLVFEGSDAEVRWQVQTILDELRAVRPQSEVAWNPVDSIALVAGMTEYTAVSEDTFIAQLSVPASQVTGIVSQLTLQGLVIQSHAANGIIHGILPDRHSTPDALPV